MLDFSGVGYFEVDLKGNLVTVSEAVCAGLGYTREELEGKNNRDFTDQANARKVFQAFHKVYTTGRPERFFDWELIHRDGSRRSVETSVALIDDGQGRPVGFQGVVKDVTDRKEAERQLRDREQRYRTIFEGSGTAMAILEEDTTISMVNRKFEVFLGYSKAEIEGRKRWTEFIPEPEREKMLDYHVRRRQRPDKVPTQYEFSVRVRSGEIRNVLGNVNMMPDRSSVVSLIDLTERKSMEEELKRLSLHDTMTGLFNRHYFEQELQRLRNGRKSPVGIVVCDVDGLKRVNDTYGHSAGDGLIRAAAGVITKALRDSDVVARIGGDEFGIILPRSDHGVVNSVLARVKKAVADYNAAEPPFQLSVSFGYAVGQGKTLDVEKLFQKADKRMYEDKTARNRGPFQARH
jgi:diguanylate cyclase (GGDEF)-like protein/PAS domain S-box-containing protein